MGLRGIQETNGRSDTVTNPIIRIAMMQNDVRGWQVATHILNVSEPTFYRWIREELPEDKQREIAAKIEAYAAQKGGRENGH